LFAIIRTGGKQYRAEVGRELVIEKLGASVGDAVTFEEVLLLGPDPVRVGRPLLAGASVAAERALTVSSPSEGGQSSRM
jgi:large subunit ribosomal protein L21